FRGSPEAHRRREMGKQVAAAHSDLPRHPHRMSCHSAHRCDAAVIERLPPVDAAVARRLLDRSGQPLYDMLKLGAALIAEVARGERRHRLLRLDAFGEEGAPDAFFKALPEARVFIETVVELGDV